MSISGSFTSPGVSVSYAPSVPTFFVTIGDSNGAGYVLLLTANGALVADAAGNPIRFVCPGGYQFDTPPGSVPSYNVVCKTIGSGTVFYNFSP